MFVICKSKTRWVRKCFNRLGKRYTVLSYIFSFLAEIPLKFHLYKLPY